MKSYSSFLENTFLFKSVDKEYIDSLLENSRIEENDYQKGETIYSPADFDRKIGFVKQGECIVGRQTGSGIIPLNTVKKFDSFGILAIFSPRDDFPTTVIAKTPCKIIFFSADTINALIEKDTRISLNVIRFLTQKINFLNDKIAAFSSGTIEEKLANYLIALKKKHNSTEFEFNKKKSAEALNCGRASLYRAINALQESGYISFDNKKIIINDPEGLERILK